MSMRDNLDISAYLVLGPENTLGRPVADVVAQAIAAGFTCVQVRSKECSARELISYTAQASEVIRQAGAQDRVALLIDDRLGVGPLHETPTKTDCGLAADGTIITKSLEDLAALHQASPVPIVVGGGVKVADIPAVAQTGVDGFFVVSAVCAAPDPHAAAQELVQAWNAAKQAN